MSTPGFLCKAMWVVEPNSATCLSAALPVKRHCQESSNVESPLMHEGSEPQQITSSAAGNLAGSITACKKVLRSNSLLESTDYWLQNQRTPCQIGFVEDESENCASVCFVNLDVNKDACITENLQQKLVNVSPDLPNLISSMNVQQPKENEIVLLSGLASGNLQADFDVSQCPWLPDICLVQCARGNRPNSTNCIIFEINKFLIGLEVVQERQLHLETNVLKLEDDTNCSLSSIEEDFLTASEHLEEEIEVDDCRSGLENTNVSANVLESKKPKETTQEGWDYHKEKLHCALGEKHIRKHRTPSTKTEGSKENTEENTSLKSLNRLVRPSHLKSEVAGNKQLATNYSYPENIKGELETSQMLFIPRDAYLSMVKKDVLSPCSVLSEQGGSHRDHDVTPNPLPPVQNGEASTGEYATNLAESVMQDAFIRLSQSQPTLPQESAVSFSMRSALLPSGCCTKDMVVPRSWNELPKIVIVQSPDGSDTVPEPNVSSWPDMEFVETSGIFSADSSSRPTQSALEVALACAATVIGTISSPQATERFAMEQESLVSTYAQRGTGVQQTQVPQAFMAPSTTEYSFPSALCGMTQVASAVAVCGLCEKEEATCPVAPTDLLPTSGASEEISSIGSLVMERSTELGKEAIAEALLREATLILARPDAYSSLGELLESVNQRIIETTSKTQTLCTESVQRNELAHTLSNVILKHSVDELHQKTTMAHPTDERHPCGTLDTLMESVNQLLHNVICFTFKKMNHIVTLSEHPSFDQAAGQAWVKAFACPSSQPLSNAHGTGLVIRNLVEDASPKSNKGGARPELVNNPRLQSEFSCSHRMFDSTAKSFPKEIYLKGIMGEDTRNPHHTLNYDSNERRASTDLGKLTTASEGCSGFQETEDSIVPNTQEKYICATPLNNEAQVNLSLLGDDLSVPAQSTLEAKQSEVYGITDFAEELAETVVSMATEIAAICLDNSNGKQPWFCAWKRGNEFLTAPNGSCRSLKRKKENSSAGSTVRKHKPPRLSEIKRKADEHPELKEKLMNRVMDESMNLEDIPDSVSTFANEVAAKIMNLTEFSMVDGVWQGQSCSRTRLLGGDRWNRLKASSCESIPEEDSEARVFVNSLGLMSTLSQPVSRASSVSKQSSCESITDEFSRFMVKQMENEGRGFELLLDYYAGKNASSIMSSAMQQACQKNDHLNVRPSCPSKQSSTESITEEFYRYMLRDIAKESKDGASSRRSSHDWTTGLLSPSTRSPLCYRQSSMPDSRSPCSRLTVNAPVKANSLDGFAQNCPQDSVNVQPVSRASSSGLCKSDSCLYRRSGTDQITNMLIHETWASSIEALMRKNKIIADDSEAANASPGPVSSGSPLQVEKNANRLATSKGHRGPTLLVQESVDYQRKDAVTEGNHSPVSSPGKTAPVKKPSDFDPRRETSACHNAAGLNSPRRSLCSRDVPLIQIETDQKEECIGEPGPFLSQSGSLEETEGHQPEETIPDVARNEDTAPSTCQSSRDSLETSGEVEVEVLKEDIPRDESRNPPSSSEESTGSWSQLANEEDIPDDTSSFLQLSERSMSNGNSSGTSSLGIMDLDIYQDRGRGAQPTLSPPCLFSWAQTLHHRYSAMAPGPARISLGSQLLPMVPLLLLLRGAGCGHRGPSWSSLPSAAAGLQGDRDSQQSPGDAAAALGPGAQDMVAIHMLRLYEKYNRRGAPPGGGNTVRSFRARLEMIDQKPVYFFNLTSMQDSEMILTAAFHFYSEPPRWPRAREVFCKPRAKNASCRLLTPGLPARLHLIFRSLSQNTATQGLLRGAMALTPPPRGLWQAKDISSIIKAARRDGELLLSAQLDTGEKDPGVPRPSSHMPYILVYANDLAISEPNSVAVSLQRYDPFPAGDFEPGAAPNSSADPRVRRAAQVSKPLQDNELPGLDERPAPALHAQNFHKHEFWSSPFRALKPRTGRKDRKKKDQDTFTAASSQVLDFDEKTMQKARRRQWDEPRVCSRRYLKVDFADIGWNEWIISPKSFDAYYCAGACEFPMPKIVRPSNHATIQSIVRAVGIVPGIPEPCCVPDKMNSLGVLFLDENRNAVLKVYPNMSVETCACR